jgi:2-polyprenyl-6-hydroxyphenyl methylase/3-demethylubiquinone-9 3-methyltransferase
VIPAPRDPVRHLARWAAEHCPDDGVVLDIGAGEHASGDLAPLLRRHPHLVGSDPDHAIERNEVLDERYRLTAEDLARQHPGRYDVILSIFVLEHVACPPAFAAACAAMLRPGGSWFALTLNVQHYFGATAWATNRLGVQRAVLHSLKGAEAEHDHRFPTLYRFNSPRTVLRVCRDAGFDPVELRMYDAPDRYAWYLPEWAKRFPSAYSSLAYRIGSPALMGHLTFRAQRS